MKDFQIVVVYLQRYHSFPIFAQTYDYETPLNLSFSLGRLRFLQRT